MAQKRMFDKTITNADDFLEMPDSSQNLYFHLNMNADDDGFINNWKSIMRMTGHKEDDLKILIAKQFVIPFESGVIVIRHWRINNYLRNDRYKATNYQEEYKQLTLDSNGIYNLNNNENLVLDTNGIPMVDTDKNRIEENSIDNKKENIKEKELKEMFEEIWKLYPKKRGKDNAYKSFVKSIKNGTTLEEIKQGLENYNKYIELEKVEYKYILNGSTWLHQHCWNDDYTVKRQFTTKDIANKMDFSDVL